MGKYNELILGGVCALCVLGYIAMKMDWENILKPDASAPVYMNGKIAKTEPLKDVTIEAIPQSTYDGIQHGNENYKWYITGNYKYVLILIFGGKPNEREFSGELNRLFKKEGLGKYYRKRIINVGNSWSVYCKEAKNCPERWLDEHCMGKVCLIHPQQKQMVIDSSADVKQLKVLLEKYKEW